MDVDEVIDELYGLRPSEFTAARDAYVAQARKAKDAAGAKRIAALRRPTLPAWASNHLVRTRPAEAEQLLALGRALREAHRTLDPHQLRQLSRQQHRLIATLVQDAVALAAQAGQPVGGSALDEIGQILRSVLADPDVAEEWAKGRLVKPPEATVGFTAALTPDEVPPRTSPKRQEATEPPRQSPPPAGTKPSRHAAQQRERLEAARSAAAESDAEARRLEAGLQEVRSLHDAAEARAAAAADRAAALAVQLRAARDDEREARTEARHTATAAREADRAAHAARRAADKAGQALKRLEPEPPAE